jgi:hypothetical protein|tara:strand:- start:157 stop:327 length:171 start_codon:yes stop_codon:yes gene_type:complete
MDKNGWQKPNIEPGMTGLQKAALSRKARLTQEKVEIIAAGNSLADSRQNAIKTFLG